MGLRKLETLSLEGHVLSLSADWGQLADHGCLKQLYFRPIWPSSNMHQRNALLQIPQLGCLHVRAPQITVSPTCSSFYPLQTIGTMYEAG